MGTLFSLSKSTTSDGLDISEIALVIFGILLVIGLIGEYAKADRWKKHVRLFEMFVIIGVAGELFADGGIFLFSKHLQTIDEAEIAEVTAKLGNAKELAEGAESASKVAKDNSGAAVKSASDALTMATGARQEADTFENDIKSAKKQAAEAESHLADALKQAADAARELAEYKARNAPRRLTADQQAFIATHLSYPNEHVDLAWNGSFEKGQFAADIEKALKMARWDVNNRQSLDFGGVSGVFILTMPTDRSEGAGKQLLDVLTSQGISASQGSMTEYIPGYSQMKVDRKSQELRSDTRLLVIVGDHP
jgi:hypothetical protein